MDVKHVGTVGTLRRGAPGLLWVAVALGACQNSGPGEGPGEAESIAVSEQALLPTTCTAADGCLVATLSAARTLYSEAPDTNSGAASVMCMGNGDGVTSSMPAFGIRRVIVQYSLPALPPNSFVQGVVLRVTQQEARTPGNDGEVGMYTVNAAWDPGTNATIGEGAGNCGEVGTAAVPATAVSWTNQPTVDAASATLTFGATPNTVYQYDSDEHLSLLFDVWAWYANPASNHGWLLQMTNEALSGTARQIDVPELRIYYWSQDGEPCSGDYACDSQYCVEGVCCVAETCDDGNACTTDSCATGSCVSVADDANLCDDGNACTADTCSTGSCVSVADDANLCDDGNACTTDTCSTGACTSVANDSNACADSLFCNGVETCSGGSCLAGTAVDCSNLDDTCEIGVCVEGSDSCSAMAINPIPSECLPDAGAGGDVDAGTDDAGVVDAGATPDAGSNPTPDGGAGTGGTGGEAGASGMGGAGGDRDAGSDAGEAMDGDGSDGCDCSTPVGSGGHTPTSPLLIGLALCLLARRRRAAQR